MLSKLERPFSNKKFFIVIIALLITSLIDTLVVKINDLIDKYFIPLQNKLLVFSINSLLIILFQFIVVKYVTNSFKIDRLNKSLRVNTFYIISVTSLSLLASLIGFMIFELFYFSYYDTAISISIIVISYGTAAAFIIWLAFLFLSWLRSSRNLVVFLYFISMSIIALNLIMTATLTSAKVAGRPSHAGEYVGSSGDVIGFRYPLLNDISKITSFMSFFSIWLTTAILLNSYREKLIKSILYWIVLSIPLVYFVITYFYQFIFGSILISYLAVDPVTVSIILGTFLSLSKPIGGLIFGVAFWNISKIISYEKNIRASMIISGWGIFLIFSANQAATQIVAPYPPFGLATLTVLNIAAFLMLLGIYNAATLVSTNGKLRRFIHKQALASKLLGSIGRAEMETEIQKTIRKIEHENSLANEDHPVALDVKELKKYIDLVTKEVKEEHKL